jgi:hypothetical protein
MKKTIVLFSACAALSALCALAFANNLVVIWKWWHAFLAAGGDSAAIPTAISGILPWLDWSAVDHSAVTTFIPLLGFVCLTASAWRLVRARPVSSPDFPFFKGSDQLFVALGLFGTLWGIIVIGYFKLETVQMADLMRCLHTALFSTLAAVVWVFLIDRPLLRPLFLRLLEKSGLAAAADGDLSVAVEHLITRLTAASDAFDRRQRDFETAFERRAAAYAADFEARRDAYAAAFEKHAADFAAEFESRRAAYAAHFEKRLSDYETEFEARQKEYVTLFRRRIDELEKRAAASDARLSAVAAALKG